MHIKALFLSYLQLHYSECIPLLISQNPDANLAFMVEGQGSEPQVVFDRNLLEFSPIMPFTAGTEAEVTISNPMDYPVELYSLEFDKQYLEEEEMLRWVREYDRQHRLFLPPVAPGGALPHEIIDAYKKDQPQLAASKSAQELSDQEHVEVTGSSISVERTGSQMLQLPSATELLQARLAAAEGQSPHPSTTALVPPVVGVTSYTSVLSHATLGSIYSLGDLLGLETSPVAACIARYLGLDISPEAALAENRRGIAAIIYGPPSSGKSTQAKLVGSRYSAVVLDVDTLIIDAISTASTSAGCRARELCIEAMNAPKPEVELTPPKPPSGSKRLNSKSATITQAGREATTDSPVHLEPPRPFPVQPLEDTPHAVPEGTLLPTSLPEELILEILVDRLQLSDCRRGAVFDGLDSLFAPEPLMVASLILKAFHNRKHIFFVNIDMSLEGVQERLVEIKEEELRKLGM